MSSKKTQATLIDGYQPEVDTAQGHPPVSQTALQPAGADVSLMFERLAKDPAVDVEKFERLMAMQERVLAYNARTAFNTAFSAMQGDIPAIVERGKTNNGRYARLEDIIEQVRPILRKHGFTLSHRTEWPDAKTVRVVGILTHEQGHERTSEFLSSADSSGNKNAIQALGSAVSYGRRYTVKDLLNIVTKDEDDDGLRSEQYKAPEAPDGYDDWWTDLEACAEEGLPKLTAAWNKSQQDFRKHTSRYHLQDWEGLKRRAATAKAGQS